MSYWRSHFYSVAIPPILLFFYPSKIFRKCLRMCRLKCNALHTFMDIFQGSYKDGTSETWDCRYFAGLYFLLRLILSSIRLVSFNRWERVIIIGAAAILVAGFRPYKRGIYNVLDVLTLALLALIFQLYLMIITRGSLAGQFSGWLFGLVCVLGTLPLLYFIILVSYHLFARLIRWHHFNCIQQKWTALQQYCAQMKRQNSRPAQERELPDRILHPDLYIWGIISRDK